MGGKEVKSGKIEEKVNNEDWKINCFNNLWLLNRKITVGGEMY